MRNRRYKLTLQHDDGQINIITAASSIHAAIEQVCKAENCPRNAVLICLPIDKRGQKALQQTKEWLASM